ncbi:MAG: rRNA maturation RNase YbeY [Oscillospiraceae bacterium]|nr:rRNA maturation RNase YbeY [Oscillospiraceae bacterium]
MIQNNKINISFDCFTIHRWPVISIIKEAVLKSLQMQNVPVPCEINVLITNDKGIRSINKASRDLDKATDVLSFPMFQFEAAKLPDNWAEYLDPETELCALGDMVISLERAVRQAEEFGHSMRREVGYLTIHSVLHLLGYDHLDNGPQKDMMRQREEEIASSIRGMSR